MKVSNSTKLKVPKRSGHHQHIFFIWTILSAISSLHLWASMMGASASCSRAQTRPFAFVARKPWRGTFALSAHRAICSRCRSIDGRGMPDRRIHAVPKFQSKTAQLWWVILFSCFQRPGTFCIRPVIDIKTIVYLKLLVELRSKGQNAETV